MALERPTDVYLQPQPPPGWLVGLGSGDTGAAGVASGDCGAAGAVVADGVASGDRGAVGSSGVAAGCGVALGSGVAVSRGGCALGVTGSPGPDPPQAVSKLLMTMTRRTLMS